MAQIAVEEPGRSEYDLRTLLAGPVVRIADLLIGDPQDLLDAADPAQPVREVAEPPARRVQRRRLDWYDLGIAALMASSAAAAAAALLTGG